MPSARTSLLRIIGVGASCAASFFAEAVLAQQPAITATRPAPLQVQSVRPGFSVVSGAGGNVVVWSGSDGTVLVDTGLASRATELLETVARVAPGALRFVISTHAHVDHTGGNEVAASRGAVIVGHDRLRERRGLDASARSAGPPDKADVAAMASALPIVTTAERVSLHVNGDRLEVVHVADAHSAADLVVRWTDANVVALGDVYWNGQYPYLDVTAGGSLVGLVAAVESSLARANAQTVIVPGHGAVSNRAQLSAYRDMLVAIGRKVREAVERGEGLQQLQAAHPTAEFDAQYFRAGASVTPDDFVRNLYEDVARRR
jgi:glyoxylase-like metal-dependent hydrolase (beta-lactamase superfamily II)